MFVILVTIWLLLSVHDSRPDIGVRKSGPYRIVFERITECEDEGTREVVFGTRITKSKDGKYLYTGLVYFGLPIDEDIKINLELQSFSNGGYRPRFMHYTFKGCEETWKYFKDGWKLFFEVAGVPGVDSCPIPAGNYSLKDYDLSSFSIPSFPELIYKKYKAVTTFYHKVRKLGCIQEYIEVVPK